MSSQSQSPPSPPPEKSPSPSLSPTDPPPPSSPRPSSPPPSNEDSPSSPARSPPPPHPRSPPPPSPSSGQVFSPPPLSPSTYQSPSPSESESESDTLPSSSGNNDSSSRTELSVPAIIGIAAGAGLLLLVMIIIIACKKQKQSSRAPIRYYTNHDDDFFKRTKPPNQQQWNNGDVVLNIPPLPGAAAVGGGRAAGTSPPAPNSAEINSSHSSGQLAAMAVGFNKNSFIFDELSIATNGFAQENLLGQGGFGYVHKGVLPNGKEVAVKSLESTGGQGDREFQAEVDIISRVHHRHLVSLVGYCITNDKKLLVYEFVPNKTLEYHLHGKDRPVMNWDTRLKIAIGAAKGLAYLHEDCHPRIIHRDIKGPNILIDNRFEVKVADFGLAKFTHDNNTHVSTRVMGTFGYLAPEYASSGKLTAKSDVFSYGVMLLELITGRRPVDYNGHYGDHDTLVDWARPLCSIALENGRYEELVDPRLENNYDKNEMARMVTCAAACVRHSAKKRPKMSQVVRALEGDVSVSIDDLGQGVKPGTSSMFGINASNSSIEYDAGKYSSDMRRFRRLALESSEQSTGEYGLIPSSTSSSDNSSAYGSRTATITDQLHTP